METDDLTPEEGAGLDDTLSADEASAAPADRSPSQQRLREEVRGRLFEGREAKPPLEPGTMIAGRYQIIGLLGSGGMGEVFRARDLVLGEDVAMKFLPASRAHDESFMRRFVNEVRLARQISHPSVCRVHDIGEVDGRAFLSMEYIDGEDLASLLRRIGRLPPEKGYELAQQLCAGLAELHGVGLLHRDLKPANLMIDGQGRLKLADFGLAAARQDLRAHEFGDGTPAYMAPEQLSGREVSERSDIYALGVVLYELLSGRHPHEEVAGPSGERGDIDRTRPVVALGARVTGLAEDTLEIVERCLLEDPSERPASVLDVAAALPGGDPIAAALRAGRAPSVDAVANARSSTTLRPWQAWALAVFTMVVLLGYAAIGPNLTLWGRSAPQLAPAVLEDRALDVLSAMDVPQPDGTSMQRLFHDFGYEQVGPRTTLSEDSLVPVLYEYRASPGRLARLGPSTNLKDPPMGMPGEVRVTLDVRGRLRSFERIPQQEPRAGSIDWTEALNRAGVERWEATEPVDVPPVPVDAQRAWRAWVGDEEITIEAGTWRGQPVWFDVQPSWSSGAANSGMVSKLGTALQQGIFVAFLAALVLLARRMYRRGEVDGRGAVRVGLVLCISVTITLLLTSAVGQSSGMQTVMGALKEGLLVGVIALLGYAIVEPYGRRYLPGVMVSWVRLTRGRWRDPLIGRDILLGLAAGGVFAMVVAARVPVVQSNHLVFVELDPLMGLGHTLGAVFRAIWLGAFGVMQIYILFLALRWVARRNSIAVGAFFVLWTGMEILGLMQGELSVGGGIVGLLTAIGTSTLLAYLIVRRGLLALSAAQIMLNLMLTIPLTLDVSGWNGTPSIVAIAAVTTLTFGALWVALGRATMAERSSRTSRTRA